MNVDANFYSQELMKRLSQLGKRAGCRTAIALLRRVTGSATAGEMLLALLQWTPKSKKEGWIYKSWRDWEAELALSRKQSNSAHAALRRVGVEMTVRRAEGSPHMHYRVNVLALCAAIGAVVEMSAEDVKNFVAAAAQSSAPNGANEKATPRGTRRNPVRQNAQSSTSKTSSASRFLDQDLQQQQAGGGEEINPSASGEVEQEGDGHSVKQMGEDAPLSPSSAAPLPPFLRRVPDLAPECARALMAEYGEVRVERCAEAALRGDNPPGLLRWFLANGWYQAAAEKSGGFAGKLSEWSES